MATHDVATRPAGRVARRSAAGTAAGPTPGWPYHAIAWGVAAFQVVRTVASNRYGRAESFVDDAYYYFETARNIATGHGSTFNGLVHTNGYHPLWMLLLVPVFFVVRGRYPGIVAGKVAAAAVWVAAVLQIRRLARAAGHERTFWIGLVPGAVFCAVEARSLPFAGVETGVVLLMLVVVARLLIETGLLGAAGARAARPDARTWWLGVSLLLLVLSRLDAVFTVAFLIAAVGVRLLLARRSGRDIVRLAVPLTVPTVAGLGAYMVFNRVVFGLALPVSGLAKQTAAPSAGWGAMRTYFTKSIGLGVPLGPAAVGGLLLLVVAAVLWHRRRVRPEGDGLDALTAVLALVFAASLAKMAYYDLTTSWLMFPWYFYEAMLVLMLAPAVLVSAVTAGRAPAADRNPLTVAAAAWRGPLAVVTVVLVAAVGGWLVRVDNRGTENWFAQEVRGADAANRLLAPGAVVAMGDRAGLFGYLADHPVITIEGVMGDRAMLEALRHGTLHRYLARHRVSVYARSDFLGPERLARPLSGETPSGAPCRRWGEPTLSAGRRTAFRVCRYDLVYRSVTPGGDRFAMWRYPGFFGQPRP